jgi:hypothetical protein
LTPIQFRELTGVDLRKLVMPGRDGATRLYIDGVAWAAQKQGWFAAVFSVAVGCLVLAYKTGNDQAKAFALLTVPASRERVLCHEAGHFLCAYYLGLPLQGYRTDWRAVFDPKFGMSPGVRFNSPALEAINSGERAKSRDVNSLAITLMGGMAAEALKFGDGCGGAADISACRTLFVSDYELSGSDEPLTEDELSHKARWAAASAMLLVQERRKALAALICAMREGRSVAECIEAIEATEGYGPA